MRRLVPAALAALIGLLSPRAGLDAQDAADATGSGAGDRWESQHSIAVGGETVAYDAVLSSITLTDESGEPSGELFYTAYFRTNAPNPGSRPIVFAYNGGPGSASFWLHMGIMGPRRVVTPSVGPQGAPPYPLEDNQYTLLDRADIVMVDPIGTRVQPFVG